MIECDYCLTIQKELDVIHGKCPNCGASIGNESKSIRWCMNPNVPGNFIKISHGGISIKEWNKKIKQRQEKIIYSQLAIIR